MTDVTYTQVYDRVKALSGIPSPSAAVDTAMLSIINRRANMAYKASDFWPRYMVVGELRSLQALTVNAGSFVPGSTYTILTVGNTDWVSIGAASNTVGVVFVATGNGSGTGTATLNNNLIPYAQAGLSTIDTFIRIHKVYQPFIQYSSVELEFYQDGQGAHIINDSFSSYNTFVTYKKVWEGPYTAISTNIPEEWFDYIAQGAYADYLRMDGQLRDIAGAEDAKAQDILDQRLSRTDITRTAGMVAHRISTHVNRAFRRN